MRPSTIGHYAIRQRGTLGGSLAHADPAAQLPLAAVALDAQIEIASASGRRLVPAAEFFSFIFTTVLEPHELLTAVHIPVRRAPRGLGLSPVHAPGRAISRWRLPPARCGATAIGSTTVRLAVGGVGSTPLRLDAPRRAAMPTPTWVAEAARAAAAAAPVEDNERFSAEYRRELVEALTRDALGRCAGARGMNDRPVLASSSTASRRTFSPSRASCCATCCARTAALTGTHVGCEHGVCGACTVLVDGRPVRSCLIYAAQAQGAAIATIEGVAPNGQLSVLQQCLHELHGLQCGFCTPGIVLTMQAWLDENPEPTDARDPRRALRQPLPLHRLSQHRRGGDGGGRAHAPQGGRRMSTPSASRCCARRTTASSPVRAAISTTS